MGKESVSRSIPRALSCVQGDRKEAAASMAEPRKEEASASEPRVPLAVLESTVETRLSGAGRKRKEATAESNSNEAMASESGDDGAVNKALDSLLDEGEMLKLKEELWELEDLWMDGLVEGTLDRWLESKKKKKTPAAVVDKKKKKKRKVVRIAVPDAYIHFIMENSTMMTELSDEEMAECPESHRQTYAIQKLVNDNKERAYQKALIDGFAYLEKEVTDDS